MTYVAEYKPPGASAQPICKRMKMFGAGSSRFDHDRSNRRGRHEYLATVHTSPHSNNPPDGGGPSCGWHRLLSIARSGLTGSRVPDILGVSKAVQSISFPAMADRQQAL